MTCMFDKSLVAALGVAFAIIPCTALAGVRDGVEAWTRGDYAAALREWQGPAEAGDADALFNMGQAYRLGRGVPADARRAQDYYARAASAGHVQAADTYGLMLFQDGQREAALPYLQASAGRGDPRARYLLGIAHFNGDAAPRDYVRAYALMTLAHSAGLPQAATAIAQMDEFVPLAQRQQAAGLAVSMQEDAERMLATQLASAELSVSEAAATSSATAGVNAQPGGAVPSASRVPTPLARADVPPSSPGMPNGADAARAALQAAREPAPVSTAERTGASFAQPQRAVASSAVTPTAKPTLKADEPRRVAAAAPPAKTQGQAAAPTQATAATGGPWRVQLGAFSVAGNADRLWQKLRGRAALAGSEKLLLAANGITRLQAAGYASQSEASKACRALKNSGQDCLVTQR